MRVEQTIEVDVPIEKAYNQWTQFEEFPNFMEDVQQVEQLDGERLHWVAEVGGKRKEWYAHITRQVPDEVIAWESEGGEKVGGTVVFTPLDTDRTKIDLYMDIEPDGIKEKIGTIAGVPKASVRGDLMRFKDFIENRDVETGKWRGEIRHGAPDDPSSQLLRKGTDHTSGV
jgi:uncharacterized membrane protein